MDRIAELEAEIARRDSDWAHKLAAGLIAAGESEYTPDPRATRITELEAENARLKTAVLEWGDAAHRQAAEVARLTAVLDTMSRIKETMSDNATLMLEEKIAHQRVRMIEYISKIQRALIDQYKFQENPERLGLPMNVPDGEYPMEIDGKLDRVRIKDGRIFCCAYR
jgi:hypothetical protein